MAILHLLLSSAALIASAQEQPGGAEGVCELHIWAAAGMTSVRQRASESNRMAGVIPEIIRRTQQQLADRADARVKLLTRSSESAPLSNERQRALLDALPLAKMLGVPKYHTILHSEPLHSRTIRAVSARYAESATPCYAELVLVDVVYSREYARGRNLKTLFRYRDFGTGGTPGLTFGTWAQTKLELFSLDPPRTDDPALNELASALRSNVALFSEYLERRRQSTATTTGEESGK